MAQDISRPLVGRLETVWIRFRSRALVWFSGAAVFVLLGLLGSMPWSATIAGVLVMAAFAVLLPFDVAPDAARTTAQAEADRARGQAWRVFADALADPCLLVDDRNLVAHRNLAATAQFPNVRQGEPMAFSLRHPALLNAIEQVRRTGALQTIEMHQTVPTETWHKVVVSPLGGDSTAAHAGMLVVTLQSLTEAKRVEAMRSDFIANASHELRTPLASLVGFIDTLLGPAARDAKARERFLEIMRAQAQRMSNLIDDLLSLSRIEMRQHVRPTGRVDLNGLLAEVVEGLGVQAEEAKVALKLDLPSPAVTVVGEREELYEVFANLVDNAIKYGGDGGRVEIALGPSGRSGFGHMISITDYGAGIATEHVPRLTERFYRVDAESSRKKKGTGLGLAIVKHILTRHRGVMTIRSAPGEGTKVEVFLPA